MGSAKKEGNNYNKHLTGLGGRDDSTLFTLLSESHCVLFFLINLKTSRALLPIFFTERVQIQIKSTHLTRTLQIIKLLGSLFLVWLLFEQHSPACFSETDFTAVQILI